LVLLAKGQISITANRDLSEPKLFSRFSGSDRVPQRFFNAAGGDCALAAAPIEHL
jgi:hypothetical protein